MEEFDLIWATRAIMDLEGILESLTEHDAVAAERFQAEILRQIELLRTVPLLGTRYQTDKRGQTRKIVCHKYRIFYRADEVARRVEILTIWHGSRRDPELP